MRTILPVPGFNDVILLMCTRRKTNNTVDTERRSDVITANLLFELLYSTQSTKIKLQKIQKSTVNDRRAGIHALAAP